MAKYDEAYIECKELSSSQIIKKYELSDYEVKIMRYLYRQQIHKENIIEYFYYSAGDDNYKTKQEISKILGGLKKKGLTYSVIGESGWLGTEIKV